MAYIKYEVGDKVLLVRNRWNRRPSTEDPADEFGEEVREESDKKETKRENGADFLNNLQVGTELTVLGVLEEEGIQSLLINEDPHVRIVADRVRPEAFLELLIQA